MSGLDTLLSGSKTQTTTMPSWYDQAQQNVVNQAQSGAAAMPALQNTVAGQAINNLSGVNNPFTQAQGTLGQIATGAANPWIQGPNGTVTPNTNTALGGLFQAQNQELQQLIPQYTAAPNAQSIGAGQFGSLRGQTAADTAIANAQAQMLPQQMQAALASQQTGINAATGLSNVGAQGTTTETQLGQLQQASPLQSVNDLAQILGTIKAPETTTATQTLPLANQIGGITSLLGAGNNILSGLGLPPVTGSGGILNSIGNAIFGNNAGTTGQTGTASTTTNPTDTSGAGAGTFPNINGGNTSGSTDTSTSTPIDTTGGNGNIGAPTTLPSGPDIWSGGGYSPS